MRTVGIDVRVLGAGPHSGIREYTEQLLAHLIPAGSDIRWKLFSAGRRPLEPYSWMSAPNVRVFETGISNRSLWLRTRLTRRPYLDVMVGGADVFFFPHFLLAALSPACRRIMTWHDLSYERMPEFLSPGRRFWHRFIMQPRAQAVATDRIIAVSDSTRQDLADLYGIPAERIATIRSGIDPSIRRASDGELELFRAREALPSRFVLALGMREPRKNLEGLLAAFERIAVGRRYTDAGLIIAGPEGWLEQPLLERVSRSPVRTRIRFVGQLRREERALWLSAATVFAYPSFLEGFGFPPLEAMACGTPVLAAANSSLFETVGDAGLLADPYAIDRMAYLLSALLDDQLLREHLIRKGYERAAVSTWQHAAAATLDVIRSVR